MAKQVQALTDSIRETASEVQANEAIMGRLLDLAVGAT